VVESCFSGGREMSRSDILTTGQVSKLIGMANRTVCRMIDTGLLKGWVIPGSNHRRVALVDLEEFMKEHGIPVLTEESYGRALRKSLTEES